MRNFSVPSKDQVNENNQSIFQSLESGLGFVPNLYAYYAKHDTALKDYLQFSNRKITLSKKEKEVVNLAVSQINDCTYCLAAHNAIAGMNGFEASQIEEIRRGSVHFDSKINALNNLTIAITANRGKIDDEVLQSFFDAGYNEQNLIDVIITIGEKTISNLIHNVTDIPIDFPLAPSLEVATV